MASMTCSRVRSVESSTVTPGRGVVERGDGRVVAVAADHLVVHRLGVDVLAELGVPTGDPGGRVGDEQHADGRLGRDHGGDVAALGDDPARRRRR